MRTGQTVIVCGADGDRAQFESFEWPSHSMLWIGVGCGYVRGVGCLSPCPSDATDEGRIEVARAYIRAVRSPPSDVESAVTALSGWLRIIERAARVPCSVLIACGGVRVSAVPIFRTWWSNRTITVAGDGIMKTVWRKGNDGEVELYTRKVIASRGFGDTTEYRVVKCGARSIEMHPTDRCALCNGRIRSSFRDYTKAMPAYVSEHSYAAQVPVDAPVSYLPALRVCIACPVRTFELWRTFKFTLDEGKERALEVPNACVHGAIFGQGVHESVWLANARVVETLALALVAHAVPHEGTFAASLAAVFCDLKLLRIVAERMLPPPPRVGSQRALACLIETRLTCLMP